MAHKSEHVSTKGGFSVLNAGVKTEVIAQDGTIKGDIKEALAQGSVYIGNSSGVTSELSIKTDTGILIGNGTTATVHALSSEATMTNLGAVTLANSAVIGKVLTGYTSGAGTVASTDSILAAIQKLNGNFVAGIMPYVSISTQSSAYNNSALNVGKYGAGIADTLLVDNILASIVNTTATNKTSGDTSSMALYVGNSNTAATANNKMQGILSSVNIGFNCYDAYAVQGHLNLADNAGHATSSNGGTANLVAGSFKTTVASGLTATGTVSGVLITMDGTGTVTGTHSGLWMDTVVAVDNGIWLSGSGTVTTGINLAGTYTTAINIPACTNGITSAASIRTTAAPTSYLLPSLGVGVYGTPVVDASTEDNIAFTVNMSTGTNKSAEASSMAAFIGCRNTAATANAKLQGVLSSTLVYYNCFDAYGIQGHVAVKGNASSTSGTGNIVGVSAKATVDDTFTATGTVSGLLVTVDGTGTVTGTHSGIWLDCVSSPDNALLISGATYTNLLTLTAGTAVVGTGTVADGNGYKLTIDIGGTPYYINAHPTSHN